MADKVELHTRERPLSTDIMLLQLIQSRSLGEALKYLLGSQFAEELVTGDPARTLPVALAVGLNMTAQAGASNVTVRAGALLLDSATVPTTAASNDTTYRLGLHRADATVTLPATGGANRWLLLTATVQQVVAVSETRDIMDPISAHFEPTLVSKLTEWRVAFSWTAGATSASTLPTIPAVPAGQVPIGAILQSATGQVLQTAVVDLRPTLAKRPTGAHRQTYFSRARSLIHTAAQPDSRSWFAKVCVSEATSSQATSVEQGGGQVLHWGGLNPSFPLVDFSNPLYQEPGTTLTGSTWYYVYLAPWGDWAPGNLTTTVDSAGVLVLSAQGPNENGFNPNILNLPSPYSIYPCPSGRAQCVGMVRTNALNNGLAPMLYQDGVIRMSADNVIANRIAFSDNHVLNSANPIKTVVAPPSALPTNTKFVKVHVDASYSPAIGTLPETGLIAMFQPGQVTPPSAALFQLLAGVAGVDELYVSADLEMQYGNATGLNVTCQHLNTGNFTLIRHLDVRVTEIRV